MKLRIESARAQPVTVTRQLFDKPEAKNSFLGSMVEDVKPNHPSIKILFRPILSQFSFHFALNQRHSHSYPYDHHRTGHNPPERAESDDVQQPLPY